MILIYFLFIDDHVHMFLPTPCKLSLSDVISTAVVMNSFLGEGEEHPAPFPEDIVHLLNLMATEEVDLVLDPFKGGGRNKWARL
jgi:hypothetical protein